MARRRASVKTQIEKTLPSQTENSWYKKPGKRLSNAAIVRHKTYVQSRYPRKGETSFTHSHVNGAQMPGPKDILATIQMVPHGITANVIATIKGKKVQGYTIIKPGKNAEFEKMYNYMQRMLKEKKPRTLKDKKNWTRKIKWALTRYNFNVRIVSMPGFKSESNWKKRRKKRNSQ